MADFVNPVKIFCNDKNPEPWLIANYDVHRSCYHWHHDNLRKILDHETIARLPVSIIAVTGVQRMGKSMLLNYLIRWFKGGLTPGEEWRGSPDEKLLGFDSHFGLESITSGLWMWPEVFVVKTRSREFAILLIDAEGLNGEHSRAVTLKLYGIVTALSSMIIYNVDKMLETDDLDNLNYVTEIAKYGLAVEKTAQLQNICFLVRDWIHLDRYTFSQADFYIAQQLAANRGDDGRVTNFRKSVRNGYVARFCYLLPPPGQDVTHHTFKGDHGKFSQDFYQQFFKFIEQHFNRDSIECKILYENPVRIGSLEAFFLMITERLEKLITLPDTIRSHVIANNIEAKLKGREAYIHKLTAAIANHGSGLIERAALEGIEELVADTIITELRSELQLHSEQEIIEFERELNEMFSDLFTIEKNRYVNELKNRSDKSVSQQRMLDFGTVFSSILSALEAGRQFAPSDEKLYERALQIFGVSCPNSLLVVAATAVAVSAYNIIKWYRNRGELDHIEKVIRSYDPSYCRKPGLFGLIENLINNFLAAFLEVIRGRPITVNH